MIILLVPLFFLELFVSMWVGERIGFIPSAFWIITTMITGGILLKNTPYALISNLVSAQMGSLDVKRANSSSMSYMMGSVLLIVPGVMSDSIGFILLIYSFYLRLLAKLNPQQPKTFREEKGDDNVIDVEIINTKCD